MRTELNRVVLLGYAAGKPEIRYTKDNKKIGTMTVATRMEQEVEKGAYIYVEGRLQTRKWQDKLEQNHYVTEVIIEMLLVLKHEKHELSPITSLQEFLEGESL
jgi:single-strand DNA-binding protein